MSEKFAVSKVQRVRSLGIAIGAALVTLVGYAPAASATAIPVTTTLDSFGIDNGSCSLREAVESVNTLTGFSGCTAPDPFGSNSIDVVAGQTYTLNLTGTEGSPGNPLNDLDVATNVTIQSVGAGTGGTRITAPAGDRVFDTSGGVVAIRGIRITGGSTAAAGGGIRAISPLALTNVTVDGNVSGSNGGGISFAAAGSNALSLKNVTITGNSAAGKGGGLSYSSDGNSFIENNTIVGNFGDTDESGGAEAVGAGIGVTAGVGNVVMSNTILAQNFIPGVDGGDECSANVVSGGNNLVGDDGNCTDRTDNVNSGSDLVGSFFGGEVPANVSALADFGGPVWTRPPLRTSPAINRGYASGGGTNCETTDARGIVRPQEGRCDIGAVEVSGAGAQTLGVTTATDDLNGSPTFSGTCSLREAITSANLNQATGGCPAGSAPNRDTINVPAGTYTLDEPGLNDTNVGGDLDVLAKDPAIVPALTNPVTILGTGTTVTEVFAGGIDRAFHVLSSVNTAEISGISMRGGNVSGNGGGLLSAGDVDLDSLTIRGNIATGDGGGAHYTNTASGDVDNVTISGNSANGNGGGLFSAATNNPNLNNVTVTLNTADVGNSGLDGSGGVGASPGNLLMSNSVVAGNTDVSDGGLLAPDCGGTVTSLRYNLVGTDGTCNFVESTGDQFGSNASPINPLLGGLADNGGRGLTHTPLFGSPALNLAYTGTPPGVSCEGLDQRGVARPLGGRCDRGAVEIEPAAPVNPSPTTNTGPTGQRAAALKKCKKKKTARARKKCKKKAKKLPL